MRSPVLWGAALAALVFFAGCGGGEEKPAASPPAPAGAAQPADAELSCSAPTASEVGGEFDVSLVLRNCATTELTHVVVNDVLPNGLEYLSSEPAAKQQGPLLTWELPSLGSYAIQYFRVKVRATAAGTHENVATVRADGGIAREARARTAVAERAAPAVPAPPVVPPVVPAAAQPSRLTLVQTCAPSVLRNEPVTLRLRVENSGEGPAAGVRITGQLPEGLQLEGGGSALALDAGTLAARTSRDLEVRVVGTRAGSYTVATAVVEGGAHRATSTSPLRVTEPVLELRVEAPSAVRAGDEVTAVLRVRNAGDARAADTRVAVTVPTIVRVVDAAGGRAVGDRVEWSVGTLEPGTESTVSLRLGTSTPVAFVVAATAGAAAADAVATSATIEVGVAAPRVPHLVLTLSAEAPDAQVGKPVDYVLTLVNDGQAPAPGVGVTCTLPAGAELTSVVSAGDIRYEADGPRLAFGRFDVAPGAAALVFRVRVTPRQAGSTSLAVVVDGGGLAEPLRRDAPVVVQAAAATPPAVPETPAKPGQAVLHLSAAGPAKGTLGEAAEFTLTLANTGDVAAAECVVESAVPEGTTFVSASEGSRTEAGAVLWTVGKLEPGDTRTVTLALRVDRAGTLEVAARARAAGLPEVTTKMALAVDAVPPTLEVGATFSKQKMRQDVVGTCTIVVENKGRAAATNVVVVCALPRELEAVTAAGPGGLASHVETRKVTFDPVASLAPGARVELTVDAKSVGAADVQIVVVVRADGLDGGQRVATDTIRIVDR